MATVGVIFIAISLVFFAVAAVFWARSHAFEHNTDAVGRVTGTQSDVKHRKNVLLSGGRRGYTVFLKNHSTGKYEYRVNGKAYTVKHVQFVTANQMPRMVSVAYLKRFPKIAYVKSEVSFQPYGIVALALAGIGLMILAGGIGVLLEIGLLLT